MSKCPEAPHRPSKYLRECQQLDDFPDELFQKNRTRIITIMEKYNLLVAKLIETSDVKLTTDALALCDELKIFYSTNDYAASVDYPVYDAAKYGPKKEYQGNGAASHLFIHIPIQAERELRQLVDDIKLETAA